VTSARPCRVFSLAARGVTSRARVVQRLWALERAPFRAMQAAYVSAYQQPSHDAHKEGG